MNMRIRRETVHSNARTRQTHYGYLTADIVDDNASYRCDVTGRNFAATRNLKPNISVLYVVCYKYMLAKQDLVAICKEYKNNFLLCIK